VKSNPAELQQRLLSCAILKHMCKVSYNDDDDDNNNNNNNLLIKSTKAQY
jgi:hypothetical protein